MSLRESFIQTLSSLAEKDKRIMLIVGDVGFSFVDEFAKRFPNQFLNAGIAEQNMLGMAAGLTIVGWKPYVYTMTNFILLRPLEQLRNDICYSNANVKLFGVKGGEAYKFLGFSHNMREGEDRAILRLLPNIKTYYPQIDAECADYIKNEYLLHNGPSYTQI